MSNQEKPQNDKGHNQGQNRITPDHDQDKAKKDHFSTTTESNPKKDPKHENSPRIGGK